MRAICSFGRSLLRLPELARFRSGRRFCELQKVPPVFEQLGHQLRTHLVDLALYSPRGLIRASINPQLDEMRVAVEEDQQWIANLEVDEKARTGIPTPRWL